MTTTRKTLIIIMVIIALLLAGVALFLNRSAESPVPPIDEGEEIAPPETFEYEVPDLNEQDVILLSGRIVVRNIGTYSTQDEFFRNLRLLESYTTQDFWSKLEEIIERGIPSGQPPFEQITKVVNGKITKQTFLAAEAEFEVEVWRSDTNRTEQEIVTVKFGKFGENWYVDGTSQITD